MTEDLEPHARFLLLAKNLANSSDAVDRYDLQSVSRASVVEFRSLVDVMKTDTVLLIAHVLRDAKKILTTSESL